MPPIDAEIAYEEELADRGTGRDHGDISSQMADLGAGRCDLVWLVGKNGIAIYFCQWGALRLGVAIFGICSTGPGGVYCGSGCGIRPIAILPVFACPIQR